MSNVNEKECNSLYEIISSTYVFGSLSLNRIDFYLKTQQLKNLKFECAYSNDVIWQVIK